jgi:hypothetical protein
MAYGITQAHSAIANWKLLFLIEAAPGIILAPIAYFFLADRPSKARFLTEREKRIAVARTARDGKSGRESGLSGKKVLEGLKDPKAYLCACVPILLPQILLTDSS